MFVLRTREVTGLSSAQVARGFVLSDGAFGLSALKARIDALDLKVDAAIQTRLYSDIADQFRRATRWFLAHVRGRCAHHRNRGAISRRRGSAARDITS